MTRRKLPVSVFLTPCPDCAATFEGIELHHEATCPLGNGIDAICDEDREYFETHPGQWHYTRPITRAERQTMEHLDPAGAATNPNHVHVLRTAFGRIRQFCNHTEFASMALDPDEEAS
jgi:hypothetical protein